MNKQNLLLDSFKIGAFYFTFLFFLTSNPALSLELSCKEQNQIPVNYSNLKALIDKCKITRLEDLLHLLPDEYKGYFTAVYKSRSIQEADYDNPRIIIFGQDAKFMLAFNGDPLQRGYEVLETIEFDDATKKFNFREVVFSGDYDDRQLAIKAAREKTKEAENNSNEKEEMHPRPHSYADFSGLNPQICLICHTEQPRPNWDLYNLWPGVYGSEIESLMAQNSSEYRHYFSFIKNKSKLGRYGKLPFLSYEEIINNKNNFPIKGEIQVKHTRFLSNPNAVLSGLVQRLVFEKMAQTIQESPKYQAYKYAILASTSGCQPLINFLPQHLQKQTQESYLKFKNETITLHSKYKDSLIQRIKAFNPYRSGGPNLMTENTAFFRLLIENQLEIQTQDWSTTLEKPTYAFTEPSWSGISGLGLVLIDNDTDLIINNNRVPLNSNNNNFEEYCKELQKKSLEALEKFTNTSCISPPRTNTEKSPEIMKLQEILETVAPPKNNVLQTCMECHNKKDEMTPYIPFDDEEQFKSELDKFHNYKKQKKTLRSEILERLGENSPDPMPPHSTSEERKKILDAMKKYLDSIE